jgi:hypothetical protein
MTEKQPRSEQQENLELEREARPVDDPPTWRKSDPDRVEETDARPPAEQFTPPGGGGEAEDREPTEIAEDAGSSYPTGPEHQAVRIEEGE